MSSIFRTQLSSVSWPALAYSARPARLVAGKDGAGNSSTTVVVNGAVTVKSLFGMATIIILDCSFSFGALPEAGGANQVSESTVSRSHGPYDSDIVELEDLLSIGGTEPRL